MPLAIRLRGPHACPVIVCDHCGEVIEHASEGNYQWQHPSEESAIAPMVFTHKACCRPFEHAHGGRPAWSAIPLEALPVYLVRNLGLTWKKATRTAALMSSV